MSNPIDDAHAGLSQEALEELRARAEECKRRAVEEIARLERLIAERDAKLGKDPNRLAFPPFSDVVR